MSYKHILVAVDLTQSSQLVIDKAISLAKDANSKLSFAYIDVDKVIIEPKAEQGFQHALQTLAEKSDYPISDTFVAVGDLHMKLSGIVKETNVDLVVCGHRHKVASRLFSSVPKVANAVEADLLVVYLEG
ncbi:universal stress protein [Vibrio sp. ZSDZ34]|jgi:universal stress protein A|uniref:Universal stress protein n=1 Tax=Vibrio gelatinilyticus TaxID=2893468 RepID=A0A9X1W682_9VIBR|nr:universal stress protein [Vibrio gelatinilyticus]MCJ2375227.1 universal stress protein [Vibrio gelatinilyticus]